VECQCGTGTGITEPESSDRRRKADERFYCWSRASQPRSAKGNEMVHQFSVGDKKRRTKDRNTAGRCYIFIVTVPDVVQRYKNRGYGNSPSLSTESIHCSKRNGGRSISQISRAKGRAEVCPSCKLSGTRSGTSDKGKALAVDRRAKWSVQQRPDSMKRTP